MSKEIVYVEREIDGVKDEFKLVLQDTEINKRIPFYLGSSVFAVFMIAIVVQKHKKY